MENGLGFASDKSSSLQTELATEGGLSLAPGAERHQAAAATFAQNGNVPGSSGLNGHVNNNELVLNYSTDFPELPDSQVKGTEKILGGAWNRPPAVRSQVVTQVFQLHGDERATKISTSSFGSGSEEEQRCKEIARATDTSIEFCEAKDHSLTVLITGKRGKVKEARARLVRELQTQVTRDISVPKEHHRILIGKEGSKLHQLEQETNCRIIIPGRDTTSDVIKVVGPREGVEKALHEIQLVSDKQSKLAQENLLIPRIYYPWIRGPNNENIDALAAETGAKINIPPPAAQNEVIVITGEKDGVRKAAAAIRSIYEDREANAKSVTCQIPKAQHRYIIGQQRKGLAEILKETGVSVEVPPEEENSHTITLRGDADKLGPALALVYAKASSVITVEITCKSWMHKFLIGPKGSTLQALVPNKDKVQIDFEDGGVIIIEGAPEYVKAAETALKKEVARLEEEMSSETMKVRPSLHRHVIGRGGSLITKIKDETGVQIIIPNEATNSDEIKVEGKKEGVKKAIAEIKEIVERIENEKTRDIIIEQRFHKQIIGVKGEAISKLREQYPTVTFSFPDQGKKSNVINLRGDKNEVDKVYKQLTAIHKELLESNYQVTVPIFKEFHKHIIGKGGANVRKIREETQTRIDLPDVDSGEDKITVTGKRANVEKAIEQLTKIQNELTSIVLKEVIIPQKIHSRLLGGGLRLIQDIQEDCGGVHIKFPPEKTISDKVTIRGPKEDVERAEKLLLALAKDRELSSHEDTVTAKPEFHRFLIGKGGAKIKKIREGFPDVRILFPRETDTDKETIHLVGKKDEVAEVKKQLQQMVNELNETVDIKFDVDPKYHRHFLIRGAAVLRDIQEQNGGVIISFPRAGTQDSKVTIKGYKQCVESAKARIEEIVEDLKAQVTVEVEIPAIHHRVLLSNRGQKIQDLCAKYNVQLKFPNRHEVVAESQEKAGDGPSLSDIITISGRDVRCQEAKEALLAMVPVTKIVNVPPEYHRLLIGRGAEVVRRLMQEHEVNVSFPQQEKNSDEVTVTGTADNVDAAISDIKKRVVELEEAAEDRKLRSFKLPVHVPAEYHTRLIGFGGEVVMNLRNKHNVQISFPDKDAEEPDKIVLTGYEANCNACKEEIENMIGEIQSMFTQEISLDASFHPRLIGVKGRNMRKIMNDYKVELRFPRSTDPDPNLVVVAGKNEDAVFDCIDHLRAMEEDYLQERNERGQYIAQRVVETTSPPKPVEVQIKGAPWQLDMQSEEQFPSMGSSQATGGVTGVWGGARRF
uniref:Vigilin n=1 Tax=Syphacia muris TaxID=451379 RepID=A0A0N5A8M1_9BILA